MSRPFGEASVIEENFAISVGSTNTEDKWREWAKADILVKTKTGSVKSREMGLLEIEPCNAATDVPIGRYVLLMVVREVSLKSSLQEWRFRLGGLIVLALALGNLLMQILEKESHLMLKVRPLL